MFADSESDGRSSSSGGTYMSESASTQDSEAAGSAHGDSGRLKRHLRSSQDGQSRATVED